MDKRREKNDTSYRFIFYIMSIKIKYLVPAIAAFAVAPFISASEPEPEAVPAAKTVPAPVENIRISPEQRQLFLQGLGWLIAQQSGLIQNLGISADDVPAVAEGFRLALLGEGKDIPEKIIGENDAYSVFIGELQTAAAEKFAAQAKAEAAKNKALGAQFIAKTLEEDKNFVALPSGILMKIVKPGDPAKKPTAEDVISVRYTGKLIDGEIFDSSASSAESGEPVQFSAGEGETATLPLSGLIKAWTEALPQLGVGGQCTLIVPADSAYGDRANGPIPPGSTLVFDIELADIPQIPETDDGEDADFDDEEE